jgi:hypothetical protein
VSTPSTPHRTTTPTPGFDVPERAERERLNAALHATNAETGFWDDNGRPAPWPDDIEDWTTNIGESPAAEPGQSPF